MGVLSKAYDGLILGLAVAAGLSILAMFVIVVVDVTMRASGLHPPRWSVPVDEYLLVYFTMAAAPYLVRSGGHVFVEMVVDRIPERSRLLYGKAIALVCATVALIATYFSAQLLIESIASGELDLRAIDIPLWVLYAPLPVGFFLTAVEFLAVAFAARGIYDKRGEAL